MSASRFITDVTQDTFNAEVIEKSHHAPVVVDYWAAWCAPCKMLMPILSKLAEEYAGKFFLAKIETDQERELATQHGIRSLPTVRVYKFGQVVDEFMGAQPEAALRQILETHILRVSDLLLQDALGEMKIGNHLRAQELLETAYGQEPDRKPIALALARVYITLSEFDGAKKIIHDLGMASVGDAEVDELKARLEFATAIGGSPGVTELNARIATNDKDCAAHYQLGAHAALDGDYEAALTYFLRVMQLDRKYHDDGGRKSILAVFSLLGGKGPLVNIYRSKMAMLLH